MGWIDGWMDGWMGDNYLVEPSCDRTGVVHEYAAHKVARIEELSITQCVAATSDNGSSGLLFYARGFHTTKRG